MKWRIKFSGKSNIDCIISSNYAYIDMHDNGLNCKNKELKQQLLGFGCGLYGIKSVIVERNEQVPYIPRRAKGLQFQKNVKTDQIDFSRFSRLKIIQFIDVEKIPIGIIKAPSLEILIISSKHLKQIPFELEALPRLKILGIDMADNLEVYPSWIENLTSLEELILDRFHKIDAEINLTKLKNLKLLHVLDSPNVNISESVKFLQNLSSLYVRRWKPYFADIENLETLHIGYFDDEEDILAIEKNRNLTDLHISTMWCEGIPEVVSKLKKLKHLSIGFSSAKTLINNKVLYFPELEYLALRSHFLDDFPVHLMPKLKYMTIYCLNEKEDDKIELNPKLNQLESLDFLYLVGDGTKAYDERKFKFKIIRQEDGLIYL